MNPLFIPIIGNIADKVLDRLIASPATSVTRAEAPAIREEVAKAVAPTIEHLTNNEPFYRSRVWWGAVGSILGGTATIITLAANSVPLALETYGPPLGGIGGGISALWGRYGARKPLGA